MGGGRGGTTGCHIHLDFYEGFDSSHTRAHAARWTLFTQAAPREAGMSRKGMRVLIPPFFFFLQKEIPPQKKKILAVLLIATGNNDPAVDSGRVGGGVEARSPDHQVQEGGWL